MKILVDARELHPRRAGIGRYIYNLFHDIEESEEEHDCSFGAVVMEDGVSALPEILKKDILALPGGISNRILKPFIDNHIIPKFMTDKGYELLYAAGHFAPVFNKEIRICSTIHDMSPFLFPNAFPIHVRHYLKYNMKKIAEFSRAIAVPSKNTANDLIKVLEVAPSKVEVIYPSLSPTEFNADPNINPVKFDKFILSVGTNEPRKNLVGLIKAYSLLESDLRKEYPLVITGRAGWMSENLDGLIKSLKIENDVFFTGFIEESMLPHLFGHADVFCYPSFYEGFGFPPLEAMYYGAPVLTSNISSLPEVVGEAAVLVNPYSIEDIAAGLNKLLRSESLRWELRDEGRVRAQTFIKNDFAKDMLELFSK